ncbi:MAG: DNA-processing protein DprA [Abditibacteriales bacterium]|nr:DNA-processing protein DprA [Abditibacteriales bacterium]MDW8364917.1 DNA-processing protein DprA [Abditibacteriales bacterium]
MQRDDPQLTWWLRLNRTGLEARKQLSLLRRFGTPEAIFAARDADLLMTERITPVNVERLRECARWDVRSDLATIERLNLTPLCIHDADYPDRLRTIHDPPPLLFIYGRLTDADRTSIAIVGTRNASAYGKLVAEKLSSDLARRGITVVSGLARGIDTAAHHGALSVQGRTIAVCGCGVDIAYPTENKDLRAKIAQSGAVLSEFPLSSAPEFWHFPVRNRVISGLSLGVVVVEAPENSGALITADFAAEQGRETFAVPGNVNSGKSKGCHRLIKDGAKLVEDVEDIVSELGLRVQPRETAIAPQPPAVPLVPVETRVYQILTLQPKHVDDITREAALPIAQTHAVLLQLEIKGLIRRYPGGMFARTT